MNRKSRRLIKNAMNGQAPGVPDVPGPNLGGMPTIHGSHAKRVIIILVAVIIGFALLAYAYNGYF